MGADLLNSSSCFLVWNVPHVLFSNNTALIPIGEKSYTNVCANTDVFLDGDFISTFASLVCHHNHYTAPTVSIISGKDVPQLTHVTFPNSVMTINSLTAIGGHDRQYFNELRARVVSPQIFVRSRSLIAP